MKLARALAGRPIRALIGVIHLARGKRGLVTPSKSKVTRVTSTDAGFKFPVSVQVAGPAFADNLGGAEPPLASTSLKLARA